MSDPRPPAPRRQRRRTARFSNSRWTEPILIASAFALAAGCYYLVERLDLASWRHGPAAIMFVMVPPVLFIIVAYDRLAGVLNRWLAPRHSDSSPGEGP